METRITDCMGKISTFIAGYLTDILGELEVVTGCNEVKTLDMVNHNYTWTASNICCVFVIALNDLDFKVNSVLSLHVKSDDEENNFFTREWDNLEIDELFKVVRKTIDEHLTELKALRYAEESSK